MKQSWRDRLSIDPVMRAYAAAPVSFNSAWWSQYKGYNTNLIPSLRGLEKNKKIKIDVVDVNHTASNPFNASTFIEWKVL